MSSTEPSDLIFNINRRTGQVTLNEHSNEQSAREEDPSEDTILCLIFKGGKMGAACYNFGEKLLNVYDEVVDWGPEFLRTRSLYRELDPKFIITFGNVNDEYTKILIDLIVRTDELTTTTDSLRSLPPNLFLLPLKEYSFDVCRYVLTEISLASGVDKHDGDKELFINSLINFDYKLSVHAAGALVKHLDKNWAYFTPVREDLKFLHVQQVSLKGHVLIDLTTFNALQIFQQCSHDATFKRGLQSSNREGLSIYRVFSSSCKSKLGQTCLKNLLLKPLNDKNELTKRLDFIRFVLHPGYQEFIESLQDNIKVLANINLILSKIQNSRANSHDWHIVYKIIYHAIYMGELSEPYRDQCAILADFHDSISSELLGLENSINKALDFSNVKNYGRPIIKFGLDQDLDAKKLRRQDISKHLTAAAKIAVDQLPSFLEECAIVYLPEMGHLLAIKEWAPDCDPEDVQHFGLQFMFTIRGMIHFKNSLCVELDETLGDINAEIIAHENRILQRLTSFVLKYNKDIRKPLQILSMIDALIAIAKVSARNNYTRPSLNTSNVHEIEDCRHPLLELVTNIETNSFHSGGPHSHIKIITGPNGSGKSIYLKKIALAIYLAHIGSYVPATSANIALMHSIHTRMQATESICMRLSAFMIDTIQTTQALRNARSNSLVLLDEFGRGTTNDAGFALLVGALKKFYRCGSESPHVVVTTHHQKVGEYLPDDRIVEHLRMVHSNEEGVLTFLFKIEKGVSRSFALNIAAAVGLEEDILARAKQFYEGGHIEPVGGYAALRGEPGFDLERFLLELDIPEPDD